jgi:predicted RNase H-like HicB family nuclease
MSNALHLTIRYEDAGDGWLTAQVAEVPGAISEGKTREEARANVIDALDVLLTPDEELAGGAPRRGQRVGDAQRLGLSAVSSACQSLPQSPE